MDYYRDEFENVVFVYVSDDMEWGRKKFRKSENVFFVGCGNSEDSGNSLFNELFNFLI